MEYRRQDISSEISGVCDDARLTLPTRSRLPVVTVQRDREHRRGEHGDGGDTEGERAATCECGGDAQQEPQHGSVDDRRPPVVRRLGRHTSPTVATAALGN